MSKLKTFNDLIFNPHPVELAGACLGKKYTESKQAKMTFENGYGISVLFGSIFYSNGIDTYEVAVLWNGNVCYDTLITNDVIRNISAEKVSEIMKQIQELSD